jgi:integrase
VGKARKTIQGGFTWMETRKNKDGKITGYREKIYMNSKPVLSPTFKRKSDAKDWKARMVSEKNKNLAIGFSYKPDVKFHDFAIKWLEEKVKLHNKPRTYENYRCQIEKHILPMCFKLSIGEVTPMILNDLILELKAKDLSNKSINDIITTLKTILNTAVKWNYLPKNQLFGTPLLKEDPKSIKFWSKTEILQFLRANLNDPLYPLWVFIINTGCRKGEALGLCWDRVNLSMSQVEISRTMGRSGLTETTKTHEKRVIPLNNDAKEIIFKLMKTRKSNSPLVFTNANGTPIDYSHLYRHLSNAQKKASLTTSLNVHGLRHTFASQFMMHGGNIFTLQKLLGHKSIDMTMKYAHLAQDYLQEASNIISFNGNSSNIVSNARDKQHLNIAPNYFQ